MNRAYGNPHPRRASLLPVAPAFGSLFRNLQVDNVSGTENTQVTIQANAIAVEDSLFNTYLLRSVSVTIDTSVAGRNGMEIGTTVGNSTWYARHVIYNPGSGEVAGLFSTSATAPILPGGFDAWAFTGWHLTDGAALLNRISQRGRRAWYVVGTKPSLAPVIASGSAGTGSSTSPVLTTASITSVVPTTATHIHVALTNDYNANGVSVVLAAPNTAWGGANRGPAGTAGQSWYLYANALASNFASGSVMMPLEGTTVAWASSDTGGAISCLGWEEGLT